MKRITTVIYNRIFSDCLMNELAYNNFMYRFHRNVQANGSFVDIIINIIRGLCCDQPPLLIPLIELKNKLNHLIVHMIKCQLSSPILGDYVTFR
jgi:hypothetical protein